ncbi:MAG: hypothetical protein EA401_00425 [Planctomycetota bacterium]|nr:MAG: hypothetical protein EA401_00425 [Planctomycetota bacterium]
MTERGDLPRNRWPVGVAIFGSLGIFVLLVVLIRVNYASYELRPAGPVHLDMALRHGGVPRPTPNVRNFAGQAQIAASGRVLLVAQNDEWVSVGMLFGPAGVVADDAWFQGLRADIGPHGLRVRHGLRTLEPGAQEMEYALLHFIDPPEEMQSLEPGHYFSFMGIEGSWRGRRNPSSGLLVVPQAVRVAQ